MKQLLTLTAMAAIGLVAITTTPVWASDEFSIDNSININEHCQHDCKYEGDIKQEANLEYSETTGEHISEDELTVNVDGLKGHKVTISAEVIETGAYADKTVEDYDNYYAIFHWYDGRAPLGSTYKACVHDHKTDDVTCKERVHQKNPETINLEND